MKVEIIPFKRSQYDRGSKQIVVDGEVWGTYRMEGHGCHGPSYHAADHHGPVGEPRASGRRKGEPIEHSFRPKGKRDHRWWGVKPASTDEQLRLEAVRLIVVGALRSPAMRDAEINARNAQYCRGQELAEQREKEEFRTRAMAAVPCSVTTLLHDHLTPQVANKLGNEMTDAIVAAMRWAQTK